MSGDDVGEALAKYLGDQLPSFQGFSVRVDAGEEGTVFVALRGAKREVEVGEALAQAVGEIVTAYLGRAMPGADFGLIMGKGNRDLLLRIEVQR